MPASRTTKFAPRPIWSNEQLEVDRQKAIARFREERLQEDPSKYGEAFDERVGWFEELLEMIVDFDHRVPITDDTIVQILSTSHLCEAFRYVAGPPLSEDDLLTIADVKSVSRKALKAAPDQAREVFATVISVLDRHRFVWVSHGLFPPGEADRNAAIMASAALLAKERIQADRRNEANKLQEQGVLATLAAAGMTEVKARRIRLPSDAPDIGQYSKTATLKNTRADVIARLWDGRLLAIECKVTNSAVNTRKRLNKEAVSAAKEWTQGLGADFVVPAAVLSGVCSHADLIEAQQSLTIWWSHDLGKLRDWIDSTKA